MPYFLQVFLQVYIFIQSLPFTNKHVGFQFFLLLFFFRKKIAAMIFDFKKNK